MWPRLVAQLLELMPHVTRLVPIADTYFSSRSAGDKTHAAALEKMSEAMRIDLLRVTASYTGLDTQIAEQSAQIAALKKSLEETQAELITQGRQLEWITKDVSSMRVWVKFGISALVILLAVTIALALKLVYAR